MRIEHGHFANTRLDGLSFFVMIDFPGPLHEGNDTVQAIIDERSTPEQRDALFQILSGKHAAEGTLFHVFARQSTVREWPDASHMARRACSRLPI